MAAPRFTLQLQGLLNDLGGGSGAVTVGRQLDGQTAGLCHLLTCQVEVFHAGYSLAGIELIDAAGFVIHLKVNDVRLVGNAVNGIVQLDTDAPGEHGIVTRVGAVEVNAAQVEVFTTVTIRNLGHVFVKAILRAVGLFSVA